LLPGSKGLTLRQTDLNPPGFFSFLCWRRFCGTDTQVAPFLKNRKEKFPLPAQSCPAVAFLIASLPQLLFCSNEMGVEGNLCAVQTCWLVMF